MPRFERLRARWSGSAKHPGILVAALVVAFALPTLWDGFSTDDYTLIQALEHKRADAPDWYNLYWFLERMSPEQIAGGDAAWWSAPDLRFQLLRPVASCLWALDHRLFGARPIGYHAHSLLWFVALLLLVRRLYLSLFDRATGSAAFYLFAFSPCLMMPVRWIAARHLLVVGVAVASGLLWLVDSRNRPHRRWLAALAFALGLATSEAGLAGVAFWTMFELQANCGRRQRWRYWRVAAPLSVGVAYLGIYRIAGAGTSGSGLYIEPLGDPLGFFLIALQRLPMLVGNAVLMADAGLGVVWPLPMIVLGIGAIVTMTWLVVSVSRQMSTDEVQALRWLVPGAGLATLGVVGGAPGGRELAVAVIGFAPLFAITLRCGWAHFASAHGMKRWMGRMVIGLLAVAQYGLSPVVLMAMAHGFRQSVTETAAIAAQIARYTSHARQVVLLTGSDPSIWFYAFRRLRPANPDAGCWWVASAARGTHRITKTGPRRLRIELVDGELMNGAFERLLRAERYAIPIGFEVSQCGAKVRVAAVRKGNPYLLDIELSQEPGSPDLAMLVWRAGRVEQVTTDERSSVMVIPWSPGPMRLF